VFIHSLDGIKYVSGSDKSSSKLVLHHSRLCELSR